MLTCPLIHPELIGALAAAGHGSKILITDANYPHSTGARPGATRIWLNLRPGLVDVPEILATLLTVANFESAAVMAAPGDVDVPAHTQYREILGHQVPMETLERFTFYEAARSRDLALLIASADQRMCANLLLTVGVRA